MRAKAYDKKTAAFAGFIIQNIPADISDEEMDGWMENPDATKKFLSGLKPPVSSVAEQSPTQVTPREFSIWKTIKRPADASAEKYRASYKEKGITLSDWADDILGKVNFADGPAEAHIIRVTVKELGFNRATRRDKIYERAFSLGLTILPHWVAPELRDTYDDQPNGEWLVVGTEPIADPNDYPRMFSVGRRNGKWIFNGRCGSNADWCDPGRIFLFAVSASNT